MNITQKRDKQNYLTFDIIIKFDFVFVFGMTLCEAILARIKPSRRLRPAMASASVYDFSDKALHSLSMSKKKVGI